MESLRSDRLGENVFIDYFNCPFCWELHAILTHVRRTIPEYEKMPATELSRVTSTILPLQRGRVALPEGVPPEVATEYREAAAILELSPRASAAMSRRCLQSLLAEVGGATAGRLDRAIDQVMAGGDLPKPLAAELDAVREIGNFAAHPMKSDATGVVLDVGPGEAEWNLEVLEHLFDFYFVEVPRRQARRDALNQKLREAGRKPLE